MRVLIIIFAFIFIIIRLWKNYISNNLFANIKFQQNGSLGLGLLTLSEYILGAIIFVKLIFKIFGI